MSLIFSESFDLLTPTQMVTSGKWTSNVSGGFAGPTSVAGRNGYAWLSTNGTTTSMAKNFSAADQHDTFIVGMARLFNSATAHDVISLWGDSGATQHVALYINTSRQLEVWRGSGGSGTLLGATPLVDALTPGLWYYIEFKVTLNDTAGAVDVRINGVNKLSLSAIDTKNAGTATVFNHMKINLHTNGTDKGDDLYVCNGAGSTNNTFLGDVRIESLIPNADGNYSQWTPKSYNRLLGANVSGIETDATGWAVDTNCTIARVTTPVRSGTGALQVTCTSTGTMSIKTIGGTSGVPVTPSTAYVFGVYARTAVTIRATNVGVEWYDAAGAVISRTLNSPATSDPTTYTLMQPTVAYTSPVNAAYAAMLVQWVSPATSEIHYIDDAFMLETSVVATTTSEAGGITTHYTAEIDYTVAATANTQDMSYVVGLTNDLIDTWAHTNPMSPSGQAVKGVIQYAEARCDTPSAKSLALVTRLAGTDASSADLALPQTYGMVTKVWETDPAAAAWTITNVAAAEWGVKVRP